MRITADYPTDPDEKVVGVLILVATDEEGVDKFGTFVEMALDEGLNVIDKSIPE